MTTKLIMQSPTLQCPDRRVLEDHRGLRSVSDA